MKAKSSEIKKIEVVIEKNDGLLWGRIENAGNFMPTPYGENTEELIENLKALITDYIKNEGKNDKYWRALDLNNLSFEFSYDLQAYFHEHDYLKISSVAEEAGLNPGLLRQYASGVKYPSEEQANKIRVAIHRIANRLLADTIFIAGAEVKSYGDDPFFVKKAADSKIFLEKNGFPKDLLSKK